MKTRPLVAEVFHADEKKGGQTARYDEVNRVQFPYLDTWKVRKECAEGGVGNCPASVCDSANTTSSKTHISSVGVTMPAPNVVVADIFGTATVQ
jgi:hypothetical protein